MITVGPLPVEEWPAYKALRLEALSTDPQAFGSSYTNQVNYPDSYWKGRLEQAAAGVGHWLLFAKCDGELVGMIGAQVEADAAFIIAVYVQPSVRGRGVGRQLMRAILDAVADFPGLRLARLTVNRIQEPACSLYSSFGFTVSREIRSVLGDGKEHSEWVMERPLSL